MSRPAQRELGSAVLGLGHVGLHVSDLAASTDFWTQTMQFVVSDGSVGAGVVFLTADPAVEHHMLLLRSGRTPGTVVQQVSFRCATLRAVIGYRHRLRGSGVATMDVSHGNAIGVYFHDPDGDLCEVYWQTGLAAKQVFKQAVDLDQPAEQVLAALRRSVQVYGETGVREDVAFSTERRPPAPVAAPAVPPGLRAPA